MEIEIHPLKEDGNFPNNNLPLIIYKQAVEVNNGASDVENVLFQNQWGNSWRNGIFRYHHYHSTAHEVITVYQGEVEAQLGGPNGIKAKLKKGDAVLIPAGVAQKNVSSSSDFACVGAYPPGQSYDMNYGKEGERPATDDNIKNVPLPPNDPILGKQGPLIEQWKNRS